MLNYTKIKCGQVESISEVVNEHDEQKNMDVFVIYFLDYKTLQKLLIKNRYLLVHVKNNYMWVFN